MKKTIFAIYLIAAMLCALPMQASAAGLEDWVNLKGILSGDGHNPAQLELTEKGLQVNFMGGQDVDDGNVSGVIFNSHVDAGNFSVEFTIDKIAGFNPEVDTWISLNLLNKKAYFSTQRPEEGQGLVTLIRPKDEIVGFQTFQLVQAFGLNGDQELESDPIGSYKVEFKKNSDGTYSDFVNGDELDAIFDGFNNIFPDGKAYFSMGASTFNNKETQITITKINGKSILESGGSITAGESSTSQAQTETASAVPNPKTGDSGIELYVAALILSVIAGFIYIRKIGRQAS